MARERSTPTWLTDSSQLNANNNTTTIIILIIISIIYNNKYNMHLRSYNNT